eukprot:IDg15063t1
MRQYQYCRTAGPGASKTSWTNPIITAYRHTVSKLSVPMSTSLNLFADNIIFSVLMATPPPSDQMRASGSGRRKVALPPGRSQLDWMRNSRNIQRQRAQPITIEEVASHKSRTDAWMIIDGTVYDVTPYLEYHPGGIPIMMSGAGKDATALVLKYHAWVNVEAMLERCVVGYLAEAPKKQG